MASREERVMPFFFISVFYGMTAYMFIFKIHVNEIVALIFISTVVLILMLSIITIWFKISIHAAGLSGLTGYLVALLFLLPNSNMYYLIILALIATGTVMSARLNLDAHTPKEIWGGAAVGFLMGFSVLLFLI
ncbi:MAG: hypothetical protein JXR07_09170 [Reichenbachiella sp.]